MIFLDSKSSAVDQAEPLLFRGVFDTLSKQTGRSRSNAGVRRDTPSLDPENNRLYYSMPVDRLLPFLNHAVLNHFLSATLHHEMLLDGLPNKLGY